jgi:serine/threonine-protein kinase
MDPKAALRAHIKSNKQCLGSSLGTLVELKEIGEGGNALVYRGKLHEMDIALKVLVTSQGKDKLLRFKAEYINVQSLPANSFCASLINFEEISVEDLRFPAILMKLYASSLDRPGNATPSQEQVAQLFSFLLDSISFIHDRGIIHRDLKPDNILVDQRGWAIADFGIAYYNPEMFKLKAKTRRGDRMANAQFSAPEQSVPGVEPNPTMDIYALGQILQWYVTGSTHRGTRRDRLTKYLPGAGNIDKVVERCLANDPGQRYQSIAEIRSHLDQMKEVSPWDYVEWFGEACANTCPKGLNQVVHITQRDILDRLMTELASPKLKPELWWTRGAEASAAEPRPSEDGKWLLRNLEIRVKEAWIFHDLSMYSDVVVIKTEGLEPFGIYEPSPPGASWGDYEEAALVDGKYYVTRAEYDNGRAEIDGRVITLKDHKTELRCRFLNARSYVVATRFHCALQRETQDVVSRLVEAIDAGHPLTEEALRSWIRGTRQNRHPDIERTL